MVGDVLCLCYHWYYKIIDGVEGSFIHATFTNTKFTLKWCECSLTEPLYAEFLPRVDP